ncbi:hypothetical protein A5635_11485 [Mycobacterium asiaticum]|uniref:Uncharacterized protein n=1 Tax=Mycobacterium asiaticum TaxID=1790 RepID=A0A1A3N073_MYCAS|nr:hypothetical protein A5635_11485 [Mycobacterium asiaticum]
MFDEIRELRAQRRCGFTYRLVAIPAVDGELGMLAFLGPESSWPDRGTGVVLDRLVRGLPQNPADWVGLRTFEFQRADAFGKAHAH